jgi:KDO2-lipid IV(A) lauroyltransferase
MQKITYFFFIFFIYFIALIPFKILYIFSDFIAFILYRVISYRKKIITTNLKNSFPDKTDVEIKKIIKRNYKNLSDLLIESLKGFTISKKQLLKRYKIENVELLNQFYYDNQSIIGAAGHICNWEWGALAGGLQIKHLPIGIYKSLSNKYIDKFLKRTRSKYGTLLKSISKTSDTFKNNLHKPSIFLLVGDQSPSTSNLDKAYWVNFLNRETACLHGIEKYAKRYNLPVIYLNITRIKRGYYSVVL